MAVPEDDDADIVEGDEGKNLSGTGDTDSCLMGSVGAGAGVEGVTGERVGDGASDDAGVRMPLDRLIGFIGIAVGLVTAARAVLAIAFCFFASFSKLWSTVN